MTGETPQQESEERLTVRNDVAELSRMHDFLEAFGSRYSIAEEVMSECELALEEIFVNVVRYGYPQGGEHRIEVSAKLAGGVVTLGVEDGGIAFNPLEAELTDLNLPIEERRIGGLGIHLVKGVMDDLKYTRTHDRNRLVMRKRVAP